MLNGGFAKNLSEPKEPVVFKFFIIDRIKIQKSTFKYKDTERLILKIHNNILNQYIEIEKGATLQ